MHAVHITVEMRPLVTLPRAYNEDTFEAIIGKSSPIY